MGTQIETTLGRLEGIQAANGVHVFRGVPYARPPLGARRFRPPQPAEPWAGVRDASAFGGSAPQGSMLLPLPGMDIGETREDCLYLNVFTPGLDGTRRPLLFWIHGGAFVIGSGAQSIYDGAALARRGDVVVVSINYRLGPLGFLFLQDLCPELAGVTGNEGILDQVAALRFVHANAEAFGGDPDNITIFGESAGGMSVGTILGMPDARGLFRRAIPQSGATHNFHDRASATRVAERTLAELGVEPAQAARLHELPVERLLAAQQQMIFQIANSKDGLLPFQPVVDGETLPEPPLEAIRAGHAAEVSLLTGTTRDEWRLFGMIDPEVRGMTLERLTAKLAGRIRGLDAADLIAQYRDARAARGEAIDPISLYYAIETDRIFRIPAVRLVEAQCAHQADSFLYRFDRGSPALGGLLGACHAAELPFVFGNQRAEGVLMFTGEGPDVDRLAELVMDAWVAFARSGDPSHPELPEPWPAYDVAKRGTCLLDVESRVVRDAADAERSAWDGVL